MIKQLQIFIRTLLVSISALGLGAQFAATAQVITMTTTKAVGDKIMLTIQAEGDVSIDGATGAFVNGDKIEYTLTDHTITIRGKVTALYCYNNQLTSLDVSKNSVLEGLWCYGNQLTNLDVSQNTSLTLLCCYGNQLTNLDVSNCAALTWISCAMNQLMSLDISESPALTSLYCYSNQIKGDAMMRLVRALPTCEGGEFAVIDTKDSNEGNTCTNTEIAIAKAKGWRVTDSNGPWDDPKDYESSEGEGEPIGKGVITMTTTKAIGDKIMLAIQAEGDISIDGATCDFVYGDKAGYTLTDQVVTIRGKVIALACHYNQLTSLDVSQSPALTYLSCAMNQLTSLDLSHNIALEKLVCYENQLMNLDVSKNPALTYLYCATNQLMNLDVSHNTALERLICHENQLVNLDVSKNLALTWFSCYGNQLTNLDVSQNLALTWLNCATNQLSSLDVSESIALIELHCASNQLQSLDVSKNTALTSFYCGANQLQRLDVSKNTALTSLYCGANQLESLDVSKNTALTWLSCEQNQLQSLDISKNTALNRLYCFSNQIKGKAMTNLVNSLPACEDGEVCIIDTKNPNEGNICTSTEMTVAKAKGWQITDFNGSWDDRKYY